MNVEVAIIGGGPGGYVAALWLAKAGVKTCLIEGHKVGGTCLNYGCIPTKAYYHYAKLIRNMEKHREIGISFDNLSIDFLKIKEDKDTRVNNLVTGVESLLIKSKVDLIKGYGTLLDDHQIKVETGEKSVFVTADYIILATGSKPLLPPIEGLKDGLGSGFVLTSKEVLELNELPKEILVIGGGVIGMEFAGILSAMGSNVTVVEACDSILPTFEKDLVKRYKPLAKKQDIQIITSSKVTRVDSKCRQVTYMDKKGQEQTVSCDKVLCSVGRQPVLDGFGKENLSVTVDNGRQIVVDDHMKTSLGHVYAIGDANGLSLLAHSASKQGVIAGGQIIAALGKDHEGFYQGQSEKGFSEFAIPRVAFLMPEIAEVSLGNSGDGKVGKFMNRSNGMAMAAHETDGLVKVEYSDEKAGLVYMGILGEGAAELIHSGVHAIDSQSPYDHLIKSITGHPSLSESIHEALLDVEKKSIHQL